MSQNIINSIIKNNITINKVKQFLLFFFYLPLPLRLPEMCE